MENQSLDPGPHGERAFRAWLDQAGLCYLYIQQEPEYFSTLFKDSVKRPDFLMLINSIGILAVDVKNKKSHPHFGGYTLDKDSELQQTIAFERTFRLPFWYAYLDEQDDGVTWYWISALHVLECGILKNGSEGDWNSPGLVDTSK